MKSRMRLKRTVPLLLAGFGMLTILIAVAGVAALEQTRETYRQVSALNERYRRTDRLLNSVASGIYVVGVLTRDYLLDPAVVEANGYQAQLVTERATMENDFRDLQKLIRTEDRQRLDALKREVEGYWDALNPLFTWTPAEKADRSWRFLRQQVLPRRRAALAMAQEIAELTQTNFEQQTRDIDRRQDSMAGFIRRTLVFTVLLGAVVATATILLLIRLQRESQRAQARTEKAEEELRRLSRQLLQGHEQERKALSRELHDEVGQMLTGLRIELRTLQDLHGRSDPDFDLHFESARNLTEQSLRSLRDLAMGLRPAMLDDLGLGSAMQWQARKFAKLTGIPVNVNTAGLPATLPEAVRTAVYRVVQEALTNAARHSRATSIEVSVEVRGGELVAVIRDDGSGFDTKAMDRRGLGLVGMQERVNDLGGDLRIHSEAGHGTTIRAAIPVVEEVATDGHPCSFSR